MRNFVLFGFCFLLAISNFCGCERAINPVQVVMTESDNLDVVTQDDFKVRLGDRLIGFSEEITFGDGNVLGALSLKSTEPVEVEGLNLSVSLSRYGDKDDQQSAILFSDVDVDVENLRLRVVSRQGEGVSDIFLEDRVRFSPNEDGSEVVEKIDFRDGFILPAGQSILVIQGDLGPVWDDLLEDSHLQFTLDTVRYAQGVISEKDYTDSGEFFSKERRFLGVKIVSIAEPWVE